MTRKFYHLMGSLDSLLRYLGTDTTLACPADPPTPTSPAQAAKNVDCIRRAIQSKAQALSTALDNIVDAREEAFKLIRDTYNGTVGALPIKDEDLFDAMGGTRLRRRTFPQMSYLDIAWALTEKEHRAQVAIGGNGLNTFSEWITEFRENALPAFLFVDGLAKAAQANAELLAVAELRCKDLLDALNVLNPTGNNATGLVHELDPTLRQHLTRIQIELQKHLDTPGGGGPGDLVWPRVITSSSSSSSSSSGS